MDWKQVIDPLNNIGFSALAAVVPVLFIFWALIFKKMKAYKASLYAISLAAVIAIIIYGMPVKLALLSTVSGGMYGLFPICWIVINSVFLFNITVKSGQFEVIKDFMASITSDRRLQALLIAFSFGSFLEGTAGFGAPVAITAAMLAGLGFDPLYAAGICLIANTAPVAFGAIGIPVTVASQVTSIPEMAISQMVGRTLPFLSLVLPFYLVVLMAGFKKSLEILPAILVSGFSFAFLQFVSSNFLGPSLPDVIAGVGSILSLLLLLKFWHPKNIWRFPKEISLDFSPTPIYNNAQLVRAWSPFLMLTVLILTWGLAPVKHVLDVVGAFEFKIPGIHNAISDTAGNLIPHIFKFNLLSASGTAIFICSLLVIPIIGLRVKEAANIYASTIKQLKFPVITISAVLGFANLVNDSGITLTMADALSRTGILFPFFSPMLGWLGVFITGSDTSANALFGKLQSTTASSLGINPVVTVAANVSGGVIGKMISPQSIVIAAAAGGLVGKESALFRFTVRHSFFFLICISIMVTAQAYLFKWIIPGYHPIDHVNNAGIVDMHKGYIFLLIVGTLILAYILWMLLYKNKGNSAMKGVKLLK
jgi:lactate permease